MGENTQLHSLHQDRQGAKGNLPLTAQGPSDSSREDCKFASYRGSFCQHYLPWYISTGLTDRIHFTLWAADSREASYSCCGLNHPCLYTCLLFHRDQQPRQVCHSASVLLQPHTQLAQETSTADSQQRASTLPSTLEMTSAAELWAGWMNILWTPCNLRNPSSPQNISSTSLLRRGACFWLVWNSTQEMHCFCHKRFDGDTKQACFLER